MAAHRGMHVIDEPLPIGKTAAAVGGDQGVGIDSRGVFVSSATLWMICFIGSSIRSGQMSSSLARMKRLLARRWSFPVPAGRLPISKWTWAY